MTIPYETFAQVDIRIGTVVAVEPFPEARKPAYKLTIDFGRKSAASDPRRSSRPITRSSRWSGGRLRLS
jgi:tRNA-binding protein